MKGERRPLVSSRPIGALVSRPNVSYGPKHPLYMNEPMYPSSLRLVGRNMATNANAGATRLLNRSEVSRLLGVSPNTVTRWAREGRLPSQVTLGGHHRFDRELVEQLRRSLYRGGRAD